MWAASPATQHPPDAVGSRLPGRVAEPRERPGAVHPEVGVEHRGQRPAEVGESGIGGRTQLLLGDQHLHGRTVADGVQAVDPGLVDADALRRLLGHLHLGDQGAPGRIPAGELDAGRLADRAAAAVGRHQVRRAHRGAVGQLQVDAVGVLGEPADLVPAVDRHAELRDPPGQDPLDLALVQGQRVRMPGREVADVHRHVREGRRRNRLPLREEAVGDASLVEDLDGAGVEATGAQAHELGGGAPLHDLYVDAGQRQLTGQHQSGGTGPGHDHVNHRNHSDPGRAAVRRAAAP